MHKMRRGGVMIAAMLVFVQLPLSAQSTRGAISEEATQMLLRARSAEWVASLSQELDRLHTAAPSSPVVLDFVVSAIPATLLPEDPRDAARMLFDASGETDRALRHGVPRALLRAEIRLAWQSALDSRSRFALRLQGRAGKAADGFGAENRRAWDQSAQGKSDRGAGFGGAGGGGSH
jgi:hypothetical protein